MAESEPLQSVGGLAKKPVSLNRTLSVAPMMDWTDRHDRYFLRQISRCTLLYTEMVSTGALMHGDVARHLDFDGAEHPVALQLGGSDPDDLARCAELGQKWGYDEINLNCGCPSDRVQNGFFGACLMAQPALVARCMNAMAKAVDLPVTVKHRIAIDEMDERDTLWRFVESIADNSPARTFIVHARKAWLKGLSPKQNRDVPPLRYDLVYELKQAFPELEIIINGGVTTIAAARAHLPHVDGVMIGREAYQNPYILAEADRLLFDDSTIPPTRHEVLQRMESYLAQKLAQGIYLGHMTRHMLGLFQGCPGARKWRRHLSENAFKQGADLDTLHEAAAQVPQ